MNKEVRWLLLIHQLPPKPAYFRVKIWRQLQRLGAIAIKNSVYALPQNDASQESFQWTIREILQNKGDATLCEATFIEGISDHQIESMFNAARDIDYKEVSEEVQKSLKAFPRKSKLTPESRKELEVDFAKFKRRLSEITTIDFFGATGRESAEGLIGKFEAEIRSTEPGSAIIGKSSSPSGDLKNRTWVTRKGIHIDRMASAWLIRKFIDPKPTFKFVDGKTYKHQREELRFDMFEAEFTHEGDRCTFEVLIERTHLDDPSLREISEIIHDLDLKDAKFGRADAIGIDRIITGIAVTHSDDDVRLARSSALFDDLYEYFKGKNMTQLSRKAKAMILTTANLLTLVSALAAGDPTLDPSKIEQLTGLKGKLNDQGTVFKVTQPRVR